MMIREMTVMWMEAQTGWYTRDKINALDNAQLTTTRTGSYAINADVNLVRINFTRT